MIRTIGKLFRPVRAGLERSPLSGNAFDAPHTIVVTSTAFADGAAIPTRYAGKKVGDNVSPPLQWSHIPDGTQQLILIMDDLDVPFPKPLIHTAAVMETTVDGLDEDQLGPGTPGVRLLTAYATGYAGPTPIPGHGPHQYRFLVFALDTAVPDEVSTAAELLRAMPGHIVARGSLTGTYER